MPDGDSLGTAVLELDVDADKYNKGIKDAESGVTGLASSSSKAMKGAGDDMDAAGNKAQGFGSKLGGVASIAGGFIVAQGITQIGGYLMDAAKGAAADEQATMRLQQTLHNLGGDYDGNLAKVNSAIAAGQELAFTDDEVRDSFQFLANATGDTDEALKRQTVAMDLARGAGIPLSQATKMVGKVTEENVETFRKLGITIGEGATEADAMAAIQAKYAGQADAYASSTAGQFEVAQIAMAEAQETIGTAILPAMTALATVVSTVLPPAFQLLSVGIGYVTQGITFLIDNFQQFLPLIIGVGTALLVALLPSLIALIPVIWLKVAAWTAAAIAMIAANLPLILIAAAIALVVAGIVLLVQHWDVIVEKVPFLGEAIDKVKEAFAVFMDWMSGTFMPKVTEIFQAVVTAIQGVISFVQGNWPLILAIITPILDQIKAYFELIWGAIQAYIQMVMDTIAGIIDVVMGVLTGDWERAWDGVKQIFEAQMTFIKTLAELGMNFISDTISNILNNVIKPLWSLAWNAIKDEVQTVWNAIQGVIESVSSTITGVISGFISTIQGYFETGKSALYSLRDTFYALRDGIIDAIQGAIGWIQNLINKITSIPSPGGMVKGALGAVGFASGTRDYPGGLGMVGEKGPELVALPRHSQIYPSDRTRQMLGQFRSKMNEQMAGQTGAQVAVNFLGAIKIIATDEEAARRGAANFAWASMAAMRARGLA